MVDKLDVRIESTVPLSPGIARLQRETGTDSRYWKPSLHYAKTIDLRPFGEDAVLSMDLKHKTAKGHPHKLELIDTGQSNYGNWLEQITRIFDFGHQRDIDELGVIRMDLNADVEDVPPSWFHEHMRVMWKRRGCTILEEGRPEYMGVTQGEGETHYWGKRPNCFRVYNKIAELKVQHRRMSRKCSPDAELPTFEQAFQIPMCTVLTRVERQIGGGRVPSEFNTIRKLTRLADYNPFGSVKILRGLEAQPNPNKYPIQTYWAGRWLRKMVLENGLQRTEQVMRNEFGTNFAKNREKYAEFLAVSNGECAGISAEQLTEIYRDSVSRQLAA